MQGVRNEPKFEPVQELFVGETSQHEAVAWTSTVSGGLTAEGGSGGYQVSAITFSVGLAALHSVDQVAGRNVALRDSIVGRQIDVQQYSVDFDIFLTKAG